MPRTVRAQVIPVECPICHAELSEDLRVHLSSDHRPDELVDLVMANIGPHDESPRRFSN